MVGSHAEARTEEAPVRRLQKEEKEVHPDHLIEELPGEESKYEEEGEAEREEDPYAHIRRVGLPGDLGVEIRDHTTGSRRVSKKTERAPPATSKKEQQLRVQLQQQQTQLQQIQSQVAGTSFCFPLLSFR